MRTWQHSFLTGPGVRIVMRGGRLLGILGDQAVPVNSWELQPAWIFGFYGEHRRGLWDDACASDLR